MSSTMHTTVLSICSIWKIWSKSFHHVSNRNQSYKTSSDSSDVFSSVDIKSVLRLWICDVQTVKSIVKNVSTLTTARSILITPYKSINIIKLLANFSLKRWINFPLFVSLRFLLLVCFYLKAKSYDIHHFTANSIREFCLRLPIIVHVYAHVTVSSTWNFAR